MRKETTKSLEKLSFAIVYFTESRENKAVLTVEE